MIDNTAYRATAGKPYTRSLFVLFTFTFGYLLTPGCAINNRRNTPVTNAVEERLEQASPAAETALLPLVWPVAVSTLAADAVVVHPVSVVDDAVDDTRDALWDRIDWDKEYATECFRLPWRVVFTPIVFGFDWLARAAFDIETHDFEERVRADAEEVLAKAVEKLGQGAPEEVGSVLDGISYKDLRRLTGSQKATYYRLRLDAASELGDYSWFHRYGWRHRHNLSSTTVWSELRPSLEEMLEREDAFERLAGYRFAQTWLPGETAQEYLRRQLEDVNPTIRFNALEALSKPIGPTRYFFPQALRPSPETLAVITRVAAQDAVPLIRARAAEILRTYDTVTEDHDGDE